MRPSRGPSVSGRRTTFLEPLGTRRFLKLAAGIVALASATVLCVLQIVADFVAFELQRNGTSAAPGSWVDWQTYVNAFDRVMHHLAIYSPAQLGGPYLLTHVVVTGYAYTPASVFLFAPFATYPYGLIAFLTLNLFVFFSALWTLISQAWPRYRLFVIAAFIAAFPFYWPFVDGVVSANVNVGLAGVIGWIAIGATPVWLGLFGAGGALTKVFPAVVAAAGPSDKLRAIVIAAGLVILAVALTLPLVGVGAWLDYFRALSGAVPDCYRDNLSIACSLRSLVGLGIGTAIGMAIGLVAAVGLLLVRDGFWLAVLSAIAVMAPVTNLHPHYWVVLPVLLVASVLKWKSLRRGRQGQAGATLSIARLSLDWTASQRGRSRKALGREPQ